LAVAHPARVDVQIIGVAASSASIIAMAGDRIEIAQNAHVMVHRAWAMTIGDTNHHLDQAAVLERVDQSIASTYADRTGQTVPNMLAAMTAETWMNADEAVEMGFADAIIGASPVTARFDFSIFANAPQSLRGAAPARPEVESRADLERLLHSAGLSREASKRIAGGGYGALSKSEDALEVNAFTAGVAEMNAVLRQLRTRQ
jgi:ATP-dependent Clp protease protease subunit